VAGYIPGTPSHYEIEPLWTSTELTSFNRRVAIPPAYVQPGHTYRVRVKFKDNSGRWSRWSAPVEFTAGTPAVALPAPPPIAFGPVMTNGGFLVRFAGIPGYPYAILTATNVVGPWTLLRPATAGTNGLLEFAEPMGTPFESLRFFRTSP
jgi:hypothetical protein